MAIALTAVVAICGFAWIMFVGGKFANDGRKHGVKWYSIVFPLVILAMIIVLSALGYSVISDAVANSKPSY